MALPPPPPPAGGSVTPSCYRHPGREGGRRCTRCGRPCCADCLVQAAVGSHCLECAKAAQPSRAQRVRTWRAAQPAPVTYVLIAINVAVFAFMSAIDPGTLSGSLTKGHAWLGLTLDALGPDGIAFRLGSGEIVVSDGNEWYRLVTSGFVHYGLIHVGFNMYILYALGRMLESAVGSLRFFLVYVASLLAGSFGAILLQPDGLAGGASGAVFGLMGLGFVGYWLNGVNPFNTGIGSLLILNLLLTFMIRSISVGGHLGGVVAGALCGLVVMRPRWKPVPLWVTYAVPVLIAVGSVAGAVALTL